MALWDDFPNGIKVLSTTVSISTSQRAFLLKNPLRSLMKSLMKFSPLLIAYLIGIYFFSLNEVAHDEWRYLMYAENISKGFYTESENPVLMNGPGYPLFLAPFIALDLPPIVPKLANGFLIFFGLIFFYKTLLFYVTKKTATVFTYLLGLYWPMYKWMIFRITDFFALFLICCIIYFIVLLVRSKRVHLWKIAVPAFLCAYLIITKLFFGYLFIAFMFISIILFLIFRNRNTLKLFYVFLFAWILGAVPYLTYTYSLTGKTFYWGTNGGEQLYWMSYQLDHEYGNWFTSDLVLGREIEGMDPRHGIFFDSAYQKPDVERDEIFMEHAKERILANPLGYLRNVTANILRLGFHYPYSYRYQSLSTYPRLFTTLLLIIPFLFSIWPAYKNRNAIPLEIIAIGFFIPIYWGMTSLVTGMPRHLIPIIPFILIWIAFMYSYFIQISFHNTYQVNDPHSVQ